MSDNAPARRIFMEIAYDGGAYHGWQRQPDMVSVQQVIEEQLSALFAGQDIRLHGSSRTDRGVHAMNFAAHADLPPFPAIPDANIKKAMNHLLPDNIVIRTLTGIHHDFHARFDALGKAYTYVVNRGEKLPFLTNYSWHYPPMRDFEAIRAAMDIVTGTHDFSAFAAEAGKYESAVRTIFKIDIRHFGSLSCFTFVGDGFLYKMIRGLMGAAAIVGKGAVSPDEISGILAGKIRTARIETCPPQGLFLMKVFYTESEMREFSLQSPPFIATDH